MSMLSDAGLGDRRVTLEQLRAFVFVAEGGGFHRAGRDLHRTQSAITQSVRKLEEILECRLLERRQGHLLGLTEDGERFLPAARDILARLSDMVQLLQFPELAGRIALGVPDDFAVTDIHQAISRCLDVNGKLRIAVTSSLSSNVRDMLCAGALDIGLFKTALDDDEPAPGDMNVASSRVLRIEPLHWVSRDRVDFGSQDEVPMVSFPEGCAYRNVAMRMLRRAGKRIFFSYVSTSYDNIRRAISAGLGLGILPRSALEKDHLVLSASDGFPDLPPVRLMLAIKDKGGIYGKFADFLENTLTVS
ncbi:MAG: LysR family transcriptional regulator [Azospirillaceae bacterium]|nr:LysR family transcriptional regulator [Azospirillaceae bacterium]